MQKNYELKMHDAEERHCWFRGRRDLILRLVAAASCEAKILEVGCSGGLLLGELKDRGFSNLRGIDLSQEALESCKKRGIFEVRLADAQDTDFPNNYFDFVIASDVLEHIANERRAISEWRRILKNGGKLMVFVPAFQFLWGSHDEVNLHQRRYSRQQLIKLLQNEGFKVEQSSYWNFSLFFPISAVRFLQKIVSKRNEAKDQLWRVNPFLNAILFQLIKVENKLITAHINLPVGLSVFCLAQK